MLYVYISTGVYIYIYIYIYIQLVLVVGKERQTLAQKREEKLRKAGLLQAPVGKGQKYISYNIHNYVVIYYIVRIYRYIYR